MTRWKFFCSAAVQMPTIEMLPETFLFAAPVLEPLDVLLSLLLPQPANATSAATAARPST
jgi:hypothetical protein